ncbi:MAG: type II toxin-antitoxin system RelB/DinJ family antitoxin [Lachnospiraceae bacterium]|jgi:addiction module RelB/DinJ family antitoxin|nr:type II toxin-antitoxin system RelB/DinJ family antitoxin [Lachnospiraceae bacterium]
MAMTNINIRTDVEVKARAQALFAQLGLDMTTAINMFLRQSVRQQALPLEFTLGDDREETLAQSLADLDSGISGLSLDEFDQFMKNAILSGRATGV